MKKITFLLLILTCITYGQVTTYNLGDVVDDFTVTDTEGNVHNLYSITAQGKYVFLDFFFVDCVPCQINQPTFSELYDKYGCNEGEVYCLSINRGFDNDADVIAYGQTYGGPFNHPPAASGDGGSGAVDTNFGVSAYPTFCLINPNNEIINLDIWPLTGVETFEAAFPAGFDPTPMSCSLGVTDTSNFDFVVYPTVSDGHEITISLAEQVTTDVTIYDVQGRQIYHSNYNEKEIQLSLDVVSGTYFINIASENGSITKSIVIK
jgi:thiol-disulfide isomerase/thioredoxin